MLFSSLIQLEFDRDPPIYYGGELLTGVIHLKKNASYLQNRQLSVELCGEASYARWNRSRGNERRENVTTTFLAETAPVDQPLVKQNQSSQSDSESSWLFEIELPSYAPPTFEIRRFIHRNHPAIQYSILAPLHRPILDSTETKKIIFRPIILVEPDVLAILSAVR